MRRLALPLALLAVTAMGLPAALAGHVQTSPTGQQVAFDHKTGNEWWVEVIVSGPDAASVATVEAQDEGGPWIELTKRSWGAWAASFHVEPGHEVRFRAMVDGTWQTSCWFSHPAGEERCRDSDPPPSGDVSATFDPVPGNEWWVETYVDASQPLATVEARADGGTWHELTLRDWGAWAASFHVPDGSLVEFRATSTSGATNTSQAYRWPSAEPVDDTPDPQEPDPLDAAFAPKAGNAWWIETYAIANSTITSVEVRVDGGEWHDLTLRDWDTWAVSVHAPAGSHVEFRATNETGAVGVSESFVWPDAVPAANPDGAWPQEGSYVHYEEVGGGPTFEYRYLRNSTFVYHDDRWLVRCEGYTQDPGGREQTFDFAENAPAFAPTDVAVGDRLNAPFATCDSGRYNVTVDRQETETVHRNGDRVTIDTWLANRTLDCRCLHWEVEWDADTGLVTDASRGGRTGDVDDLQDTDAPIG